MSWNYWADADLPDSILRNATHKGTYTFGSPETHAVTHTQDSHTYSLYEYASGYAVKVSHGGGIYWITTIHGNTAALFIRNAIESLSSAQLWELCDLLFSVYESAAYSTGKQVSAHYQQAFAEGRLKKRKTRGANTCKVWIEPMNRR